ncbi:hypothetical protein MMU07_03600 [Aquiflexum sp. LQ15W]|uniref:hypothetical protein n=1 Tax=Cognataquiflexum nitidum TaxID=2922272 RepID=UPI001F14353B|nr:hypothetical protein [Cognataquiflexum nitidum]MCH6198651.1 hypothetical protein [Cognataquiflexum nitidum]
MNNLGLNYLLFLPYWEKLNGYQFLCKYAKILIQTGRKTEVGRPMHRTFQPPAKKYRFSISLALLPKYVLN